MFKKLKRIICAAIIVCMALTAFVACKTQYNWGPYAENASLKGDVIGENGGMAVQKGGYLYFINGTDTYNNSLQDNEFGKVIKGSICRMPISDLDKTDETERNANVQIIVPKVIVANDTDAGFFIFGDWIYYTTPNSERGTKGTIQYDVVDFMKARVDGTGTERLTKIDSAGATIPFRFIETGTGNNKTVYLVYYFKETLYKLNATANGSVDEISDKITSYAFGEKEVFYTKKETRTDKLENEKEEDFNTVYSADPSISQPEKLSAVFAGYIGVDADTYYANNSLKYKFSIIAYKNGILFYTRTREFGGLNADKGLWGYNGTDIKPFTPDYNGTNFLAVGWDAGADGGLVVFNGTKFIRYTGASNGVATYDGSSYDMYFPDSTSITLYFLNKDSAGDTYLYYGISASYGEIIWRFDINLAASGRPMLGSKAQRITLNSANSSWLKPKLIDGKIFFISNNDFRDSEGEEVLDEYADVGYIGYTYFVDLTNLPDADAGDDVLNEEIAKEVWFGKHDESEKDDD